MPTFIDNDEKTTNVDKDSVMAEQRIANWSSLGALIKSARNERGLTQQALADKAGVSRAWLAKVESGHRGAEFEQIVRTLSALDISLMARMDERSERDSALDAALARKRSRSNRLSHG
jgi:y4mF family transcriptional regulator